MKRWSIILGLTLIAVGLMVILIGAPASAHPPRDGWWQGFAAAVYEQEFSGQHMAITGLEAGSKYASEDMEMNDGVAWIFHPGISGNCSDPGKPDNGCRIDIEDFPEDFDGGWEFFSESNPIAGVGFLNNNPSGNVGITGGTARSGHHVIPGDQNLQEIQVSPIVFGDYNNVKTQIKFFTWNNEHFTGSLQIEVLTELNDGTNQVTTHTIPENGTLTLGPADIGVGDCGGGTGSGFNNEDCIGSFYANSQSSQEWPVFSGIVSHYSTAQATPPCLSCPLGQIATHATIIDNHENEGNAFLPTMKNSYYGDDATTVAYVSNITGSDDQDYLMRYVIAGVESGCSGVSVGDIYTDTMTIPRGEVREVGYAAGNVGGMPNCVLYTATIDVDGAENDQEDIPVTVIETHGSGITSKMAAYNGRVVYALSGGVRLNFPLYKEDFEGNQGAITVMVVGNIEGGEPGTCTEVNATFYQGASDVHVLQTDELCVGEAVVFRRVSDGDSGKPWTEISGGTPDDEEKYMVGLEVVDDEARIAAIYQESSYNSSTTLDIWNYEGASEVLCSYSDPLAWCE